MQFFKNSALALMAMASAVVAQEWGNFTGEVTSIEHLIGKDYSLTSSLVISLNQSWSLVDIVGRRDGQISNKSIIYNTADSKYYATIAYTNTATSEDDNQLCFPAVPIRISLNEDADGTQQGRLIDGSFYIGCVDKSRVINAASSTSATTAGTIGTTSVVPTTTSTARMITITESTGFNIDSETTLSVSATASASATAVSTVSTEAPVTTSVIVSTVSAESSQPISTTEAATTTSAPESTSTSEAASSGGIVIVTVSSSVSESSTSVSTVFEVMTSSFESKTLTTSYVTTSAASTSAPAVTTVLVPGHNLTNGTGGVDQSNSASSTGIYSTLTMGVVVLVFAMFA